MVSSVAATGYSHTTTSLLLAMTMTMSSVWSVSSSSTNGKIVVSDVSSPSVSLLRGQRTTQSSRSAETPFPQLSQLSRNQSLHGKQGGAFENCVDIPALGTIDSRRLSITPPKRVHASPGSAVQVERSLREGSAFAFPVSRLLLPSHPGHNFVL
ncbi:hypothetical protein DFJ77DRAFT_479266 [Powellomyces hirtus]|nr:hypothetical protein DFJ77DRAFT_479266 [Powellomyces hirtus]